MYKLTTHAKVERQDRLFAIIDTIGIGNEVDKFYLKEEHVFKVFTDTGVMLVVNEGGYIVTAFAVNMEKAYAVYRSNGRSHISPRVTKAIHYHEEHYKFLAKL